MNTDRPTPTAPDRTTPAEETAEPTVMLSAPGDPTVALPGAGRTVETGTAAEEEPVAGEAAPADGPDPTVALVGPADESEGTVVFSPVPRPRISPDARLALPLQRETGPGPDPAVVPKWDRRRLLLAIPAVAGTALLGGAIASLAGGGEPETGKAPNLQVSEPAPVPSPTRPRSATPVLPAPVHTLDGFRELVPGDPFPADAIALTIDDGPHPVWTPAILRLLEKHHVPALFCMIGNQVRGHEVTAKDVAAAGHQIANHTWSHPIDLAGLPADKISKEIHRAQDKIYSTTGASPHLFRAPGGAWSTALAEAVSRSGVIPMDWTNDPRDWARPGIARITKRLLAARPGQILLCHDGGGDRSQTLAALTTVIPALQAKGLTFVALA